MNHELLTKQHGSYKKTIVSLTVRYNYKYAEVVNREIFFAGISCYNNYKLRLIHV